MNDCRDGRFGRSLRALTRNLLFITILCCGLTSAAWAGLSASPNPNTGSYTVSWTLIPGTDDGYRLQQSTNGGSTWSSTYTVFGLSKAFSSVAPGTYTYRLKSCSLVYQWGEWLPQCSLSGFGNITVTVNEPVPGVPSAISGPSTDYDGSYSLSWGSVTGATSYELQRKLGSGSWATIQNTSSISRSESGLSAGTYSYRVRACNAGGCSAYTATKTVAVTLAPTTPGAITGPSTDNNGAYTVSWGSSSAATSYEIQRQLNSGSWSTIQNTSSTSRVESGLGNGTYGYHVRACNVAGCSNYTATKNVVVLFIPATPGSISGPGTDTDGAYTVSWSAVSTATSYTLQRQLNGGSWATIQSTSAVSRAESGLGNGSYSYRVSACNASGCSGYSATKTVVVALPPATPSAITGPSSDADGAFTLNWGSSSGTTYYTLFRRVDGGSWAQIQYTNSTTRNESGLADGEWDYIVRACNASGCSGWTPTKSVDVARPPSAPGAITGPDEVDESSGAYTLTWTDAVGSTTSYELQESVNNLASWSTVQNTTAKTKSFTGKSAAEYNYRVRGCNTVGSYTNCGYWTSVKFVDVQDFQQFALTSPSTTETGAYLVTWDNLASEIDYLQESVDGAAWTDVYVGQDDRYAIAGRPDGTYRYRIKRFKVVNEVEWYEYTLSTTTVMGIIPEPPVATPNAAGNVPYETGVTKGGNAYITVPIAPAPGVNGLQPSLAFAYNSGRERQQGDESLPGDTLGYGWSLSGISSIRRCVKNQPSSTNIVLTVADRLCLNGEPLVVTSGTYWTPGSEYRTLRESYQKVVLQGTINEPWFEVHMPDGLVIEYGNSDESRVRNIDYHTVNGNQVEDESQPYIWSISRVVDAFGNDMTFNYYQDLASGINHPKSIVYGYNDDSEIRFEYIGRDDLDPLPLASTTVEQLLLLHTVRVRTAGKTVREYVLENETVVGEGWRRLSKLQLCGYAENGIGTQCLEPLELGWSEPTEMLEHLTTYVDELKDSLGAITQFTHGIVHDDGNDSFLFSERPFGNEIAPTEASLLGDGPSTADPVKSVVTRIRRSDGIGGWHDTDYAYHGVPFESTKNWGYLGFYATRTTDVASGVVTYRQYRLDYPFFAEVARTKQYDGVFGSHNETLTNIENQYDEEALGSGRVMPYLKTVTSAIRENDTEIGVKQVTTIPQFANEFVTTSQTTTVFAENRTPDQSTGPLWGDVDTFTLSGVKRSIVLDQIFSNDTTGTNWLLGFATSVTAKHYPDAVSPGTEDQTQISTYEREPGTSEIKSQTDFPGGDNELITSFTYDARGNLSAHTISGENVAPRTTTANNITDGRYPTFVRNPLNHDTDLVYDLRFGSVKQTTDPNNRISSVVYDGFGREISRTTPDNIVITTTYKRCGPDVTCTAVDKRLGGSVAPSIEVETTSSVSPTSRQFLDELGRVIRAETQSFDGTYVRIDTEYDDRGRVLNTTRPYKAGNTVYWADYEYDIRNRVKKENRPDGSDTAFSFTVVSGTKVRVTTTDHGLKSDGVTAVTQRRKEDYNILGELVMTIDDAQSGGLSVRTDYEYFGSGLPKLVEVDPGGADLETTFDWDEAGNRTSITGPDIGTVTAKYTALGELREQTDAEMNTITLAYDLLGRLKTKTDPDGTADWTYDPVNAIGALSTRTYGSDFSETFTYQSTDSKLEQISTQLTGGPHTKTFVHSYEYDSNGRIDRLEYPSGIEVEYGYNTYGYLETVTDTSDQTDLKTFTQVDAYGNVKNETYGNNIQTARTFDPKTGRLLTIDTTLSGSTFQENQYKWQTNGILESRVKVDGSTTTEERFTYDGLDRLKTSETFVNSASTPDRMLSNSYDIRGNLTNKSSDVSGDVNVTNFGYAVGKNRLDTVTIAGINYSLSYDSNGSITRYDRLAVGDDKFIVWNARNLPKTIVVGESLTVGLTAKDEFAYGPEGQRFYKKTTWDDSGTERVEHTFYVGSFEELVTDASDTQLDRVQTSRVGDSVLHLKSFPDVGSPTTKIEYLHRDHLGSVEVVTDENGNELRVMAFDPFGDRRKEDWSRHLTQSEIDDIIDDIRESTSRGFTGQENLDRTGLVHMNGRVYDPTIGRFLSADPIVQSPYFSQSWNRYAYVMNSPMTFNDPTGYVRYDSSGTCSRILCRNFNGNNAPSASGPGGNSGPYTVRQTVFTTQVVREDLWVRNYHRESRGWSIFGVCVSCIDGDSTVFGAVNDIFSYTWELVSVRRTRTIASTEQRTIENSTESSETDEPMDSGDDKINYGQAVFDLLDRKREAQRARARAIVTARHQAEAEMNLWEFVELADLNFRDKLTISVGGEVAYGAGFKGVVSTNVNGDVAYDTALVKGVKLKPFGYIGAEVISTGEIQGFYQEIEFCAIGCANIQWNYQDVALGVSIGLSGGGSFNTGFKGDL